MNKDKFKIDVCKQSHPFVILFMAVKEFVPVEEILPFLSSTVFMNAIDELYNWNSVDSRYGSISIDARVKSILATGFKVEVENVYGLFPENAEEAKYIDRLVDSILGEFDSRDDYHAFPVVYQVLSPEFISYWSKGLPKYFEFVHAQFGEYQLCQELVDILPRDIDEFQPIESGMSTTTLSDLIGFLELEGLLSKLDSYHINLLIDELTDAFEVFCINEGSFSKLSQITGAESALKYFESRLIPNSLNADIHNLDPKLLPVLGSFVFNADIKDYTTKALDMARFEWLTNVESIESSIIEKPYSSIARLFFNGFLTCSPKDASQFIIQTVSEDYENVVTSIYSNKIKYLLSDRFNSTDQWGQFVITKLTKEGLDSFLLLIRFKIIDRLLGYLQQELDKSDLHVEFTITQNVIDLINEHMDKYKIGQLIHIMYSAANGAINKRSKGAYAQQAGNIAKSFIKRGLTEEAWRRNVYDWPSTISVPAEWDCLLMLGLCEWRSSVSLSFLDIAGAIRDNDE
jgi:hypothetical protein